MALKNFLNRDRQQSNCGCHNHGLFHGGCKQTGPITCMKAYGMNRERAMFYSMPELGRRPQHIVCPYCHRKGITRTRKVMSAVGIGTSVMCCLVFWPLFWVPLVAGKCQTVVHYCCHCQKEVGDSRPLD